METKSVPTLSPSQTEVWLECPQKHYYAYVEKLKKRTETSKYMERGTYAHEILHVYYQLLAGSDLKAGDEFILHYIKSRFKRDFERLTEENVETYNVVSQTVLRFLRAQSPKIDGGIEVLAVEGHLSKDYTTPKGRTINLHGYVDLIYRARSGGIRIRDHKTGERAGTWSTGKVSLLTQLLFYGLLYLDLYDTVPAYAEVSFLNTYQYKEEKPAAQYFEFYPRQINRTSLELFRSNILAIADKILDREPHMRLGKDCSVCPYFALCETKMAGGSLTSVINTYYTKVETDGAPVKTYLRQLEESSPEKDAGGNPPSKPSNGFTINWGGKSL